MLFTFLEFIYFVKNLIIRSGNMKKFLAAVAVVVVFAILSISCSSSQKCAAYGGDRQRYQIERR